MDVEIGDAKNPLAQVINEKKALIVEDPEKLLGPLLIPKFFAHFYQDASFSSLNSQGEDFGRLGCAT